METFPEDYNKHFHGVLSFLRFCGVDFFEKPEVKRRNQIIRTLWLSFIIMYLCQATHSMINSDSDAINHLPMIIIFGEEALKALLVIKKKDKIRAIMEKIAEMWPDTEQTSNRKLAATFKMDGIKLQCFCDLYFKCCVGACLSYYFPPVIYSLVFYSDPKQYQFSVPATHLFQITGVPTYLLCFLMESLPVLVLVHGYTVPIQRLMATFSGLTTAMFRSLKMTIEQTGVLNNMNDRTLSEEELAAEELSAWNKIIYKHQRLLYIVNDMNHVFSEVWFITLILSSIVICGNAFLTVKTNSIIDQCRSLVVVVTVFTTVFLHCLPGQMLIDSSLEISEAAYNYPWYRKTLTQICVKMLILRANKPACLWGFKYYKLSYTCFTSILSTTASYFSLLRQLYKEKEIK